MAIHEGQLCNPDNDYQLGFSLGGPQKDDVVLMQGMYGSCGGGSFNQNNLFLSHLQEVQEYHNPLQQQHDYELMQQLFFDHQSSLCHPSFHQSIAASCLDKQRMELDCFINLQHERLRTALEEQRKQHTAFLLKKYESRARFLLELKDGEITKAAKRTLELQDFLQRMEIESQTWQRVAKENETMIESLRSMIERVKESACLSSNTAADDAESCCLVINGEEEEEDKAELDSCSKYIACRCCKTRRSRVIVLPCRHMCSCTKCEVFLDSCPVCGTMKRGSIEAIQ